MSKRGNQLDSILSPVTRDAAPKPVPERKASATPGSLKVMGMSLESINADAEELEALRSQMASGNRVIEIDPDVVDRSPFHDRLDADDGANEAFEALKASIADGGQQVPILVRPHPEREGRYQAAYGHRRMRAAKALGIKVKAIVRNLEDRELVVAQGKENLDRSDLSFIERAQFAAALEDRGFDRATIGAAVEPNKGNLSVLLSVARAVPADVVAAIGPAAKIGRPRWIEFTALLQSPGALERVRETLAGTAGLSADSNVRFNNAMAAAMAPAKTQKAAAGPQHVVSAQGERIATLERGVKRAKLVLQEPDFAAFVAERLSALHAEWRTKSDQ
ncbi:plasmid partitioning protein RepB [Microvirga tunisiensis]|uniref:Plasmid partitioning protein RepB n=1 Tax=Microvirga tunisiensis TaxID=2108360 RepID=A0A5N7MKL6_9HYPH|nr:plasmid partitioning protein RepB [Microvirga tunisiensis]MPR09195.1 plasmid partitioning protein RepB [Microvirga tunisiensis]MPR27388.1 plasmid partitioning protein RepB [Microvirga tunisiensis]